MVNKIRYFRKKLGLSQTTLAQKIGVSQNTISSLECEIYDPRCSTALKISQVFGVPVEEIFKLDS